MYKTNELEFEKFLLLLFAALCFINIVGTSDTEKYLETKDSKYINKANNIFIFTLSITFLIYVYFFIRNYKAYESSNTNQRDIYRIKLLGSSFLIAGILCLLYFQNKQVDFIGTSVP